jgi:hypothetical protein
MPKTKISEFSATPANNTDIDSINISEGCAPSGINDAIRELMAQLKDFQVGSAGDPVTVGGVLTVQAGAVGTPAITTAGDTNTGIFFPAADTIAFAEGGAEVARFDSSANMGLGTASPSAKLHVVGGTSGSLNAPAVLVQNNRFLTFQNAASSGWGAAIYADSSDNGWIGAVNNLILNTGSGATERARITSTGNMGLGTSSPATKLEIAGNGNQTIRLSNTETSAQPNDIIGTLEYYSFDGDGAHIGAYVRAIQDPVDNFGRATALTFGSNAVNVAVTEGMRLSADGNLLVGTTLYNSSFKGILISNNGRLYATADGIPSGTFARLSNDGDVVTFVRTSTAVGSVSVTTTATAYNTSSDYRLKNITGNLTGYKERLMSLQPKQGTWIVDGSEFRGFLAHDFAGPYRASVTGEKDAVDAEGKPVMQAMQASSSEVMADLVAMVKELVTENASLKARLDAANL